MTESKANKKKRKPIGIRLDNDILKMLDEASKAANVSRTEIIEECVKAHASDYIKFVFEKRKSAFDDYLKTSQGKK